ncbi:hypothetical protein SAMN04487967_1251 [Natronorubrum sediminis]|uniref:Uncharacterized protein n=1 Tax=Natronorubrum sediminis TaxID=640943 RepID=A0A1H6FQR3_9EURY|nr:hypothetical protein [Natronorubrum sediminis]SEH13259.1 hypothetical protein SAMN04487967_1251 [Natronorubrum sediminis]
MESDFVNPYFKNFLLGSVGIWFIGAIISAVLFAVNIILGLLSSIVVALGISYFLFFAIASMCEDLIDKKANHDEIVGNHDDALSDSREDELDSTEEADKPEVVGELNHSVVENSNIISIPDEDASIFEVTDEERSGEFILQNGSIRVASPMYQRKFGEEWVAKAKEYLASEISDKK